MADTDAKFEVEKALKLITEYFRDYVFALMSVLWTPFSALPHSGDGSAETV